MNLSLSQNIRAFRKQRKLTQEQLAEALGVTTGAVYKWESGLSAPELNLLLELADLFDVSVDALLGYGMKDNRMTAILHRLAALCRSGDAAALAEAEKALVRYPNAFEIVHGCAQTYHIFGTDQNNKEMLRRALALYEHALVLIPQNTKPSVSPFTIYGEMGIAYLRLEEPEKGLDLLIQHNAGGMFNDTIGTSLSMFLHRPEEAEPYLSAALLQSVATLINTVGGYAFLFIARGDWQSEREIVSWGYGILLGLRQTDEPSFLDKTGASLLVLLAHAQIHTGAEAEARASLEKTAEYVRRFDSAPDFGLGGFRFASAPQEENMHDSLGATAGESVENLLKMLRDPALDALWKEVSALG